MLNLVVTVVLTYVLRAVKVADGLDRTEASDYHADAGDPRVGEIPELTQK